MRVGVGLDWCWIGVGLVWCWVGVGLVLGWCGVGLGTWRVVLVFGLCWRCGLQDDDSDDGANDDDGCDADDAAESPCNDASWQSSSRLM